MLWLGRRLLLLYLALLLLALGLVLVLLGFVQRGGLDLGLGHGAQLFLVVVGDKVVVVLCVDHQLDRGFIAQIVHFGQQGCYFVQKFFVSHGASFGCWEMNAIVTAHRMWTWLLT